MQSTPFSRQAVAKPWRMAWKLQSSIWHRLRSVLNRFCTLRGSVQVSFPVSTYRLSPLRMRFRGVIRKSGMGISREDVWDFGVLI